MPDFSDSYLEELKKKIRFFTDHDPPKHKLSPSKEERESPVAEMPDAKTMDAVSVPESKDSKPVETVETGQKPVGEGENNNNNAIIFSLKNQVTGLVRALRVFQVSVLQKIKTFSILID